MLGLYKGIIPKTEEKEDFMKAFESGNEFGYREKWKVLFVSIIVFLAIGLFSDFAIARDSFGNPYEYWSYGHSKDFPVRVRARLVDEHNKEIIAERLKKVANLEQIIRIFPVFGYREASKEELIASIYLQKPELIWTVTNGQFEWEQQMEFLYEFVILKKDGSYWQGEAVVKKKPYYHVEIRPMKKTGKHNCVMERVVK